jgi:hypothetical protein
MEIQDINFIPRVWAPEFTGAIEARFGVKIINNSDFLFCPCLTRNPPEMGECGSFPSWCLPLRCRASCCIDRKKWMVCVLCLNNDEPSKRMYNTRQLVKHERLHVAYAKIAAQFRKEDCGEQNINNEIVLSDRTNIVGESSYELQNTNRQNPHVHQHIKFYRALTKMRAMQFVVNTQFSMESNVNASVSTVDARLHTLIGFVALSQTKNQSKQFAKLLQLIDQNNKKRMAMIVKERDYYRYVKCDKIYSSAYVLTMFISNRFKFFNFPVIWQ